MINTLLWRCPLCAAEEALQHRTPLLRPEQVTCTACGARWRVRRVPGSDFRLRLEDEGDERPLAEWYDRMKAGVRLEPRPSPLLRLADDEALYLVSGPARLEESTLTPDHLPGREREATLTPDHLPSRERGIALSINGRGWGRPGEEGMLFLTNRRVAWQAGGQEWSCRLERVGSALAVMNLALALLLDGRLYLVRFQQDSLLKWVTYFRLVADEFAHRNGHRIQVSHD